MEKNLVGGIPTPLKNITVISWDDYIYIPNIWICLKPCSMFQSTNQTITGGIPTFNLPPSVVSLKVSSSGSSIPVGDNGSRVRMVGSLLIRLMNLAQGGPL